MDIEQVDLFEFGSVDPLMETLKELTTKESLTLTIKRKKVLIRRNRFNNKDIYEFETEDIHEPCRDIDHLYHKLKKL